MTKLSESYLLEEPYDRCLASVQADLGADTWETDTFEGTRYAKAVHEFPSKGFHNEGKVGVFLYDQGDQTQVVLAGQIFGMGPIQKKHLAKVIAGLWARIEAVPLSEP